MRRKKIYRAAIIYYDHLDVVGYFSTKAKAIVNLLNKMSYQDSNYKGYVSRYLIDKLQEPLADYTVYKIKSMWKKDDNHFFNRLLRAKTKNLYVKWLSGMETYKKGEDNNEKEEKETRNSF